MKPLIAIALSGGVDSMMAAAYLKERDCRVVGIHFLTGYQSGSAARGTRPADALPGGAEPSGIRRVAAQLGIPVEIYDCSGAFQAGVVDYFTRTYQAGRTPNPCLVCNAAIKFGVVLAHARNLGATRLATGHYARRIQGGDGRFHLHRGIDPLKDQSYFLARLTQAQLGAACFPLGAMTKSEVVSAARRRGLSPVSRQESQDVCFIPNGRYGRFLTAQAGFHAAPGPIEDRHGNTLGQHPGTHLFTVGQRRGLNCPAAEPYYVLRIDPARNRLVVGRKEDLRAHECRVDEINWLVGSPPTGTRVHTRLRYRHRAVASTLVPDGETSVIVRFDAPQEAVTPGQGAVFYRGEEVIGGGWIQRAAA